MSRQIQQRAGEHPRMRNADWHFWYEPRQAEDVLVQRQSEAEPRLGPYETRYPVQLGYATPPRAGA